MTAEMITDNSEETLAEDNFEETGDELDDVHGDEELHSDDSDSPEPDDAFWHGNPEELPQELKSVYKNMQRAFTKRMQRASDLEEKYLSGIQAANAAVLARAQEVAPQREPEVQEEAPPDMSAGAKPEDVISYYVQKEVQRQIKESGVDRLTQEMQPVAHRERVVSAYRSFASENPGLDHSKLAPLTGQIIDKDDELTELASVNPAVAIKLASRIAKAELAASSVKAKSKRKRQAAPVSARSGSVVKRKPESMLEAATRALKDAGLSPDGF